ncbi:acyl-CoA dehydrogenase family protein [Tomitella fengzijianii]|uniref:Acyl-CoA dehydrogenase n=1 Tax=Tomitella fengzijianii TaxID=2597660 RepID=A0A516X569_9ACTN|nr:acyl-CoA dehydrogenase [Tomitella fengzijianii]QDQ98204.1 acyl-CoA dehydrogenase [Tomitella fengzijianii]
MRFALEEIHDDFAASLDSLLSKADLPAVIRAWSDGDSAPGTALWGRLAETGVNGLLIGEDDGGMGADALFLIVAAEKLGYHGVPGPVAETLAVAPALLAAVAPDRLGALSEGALATVAAPPATPYAVDADTASTVLRVDPAADGGATVALGEPGARAQSVDRARHLYQTAAGSPLGTVDSGVLAAAQDLGALATAAQLQGLGQAMLDSTVEYAKQRKQFGRAIGSQQAVKHLVAEVAVAVEMARPLLHAAAMAVRDGAPTARRDVSAAKVACGQAAYHSSRVALQVHGAIGYTQEHDLSLLLTKTRALVTAWGTPAEHRGRIMEAL